MQELHHVQTAFADFDFGNEGLGALEPVGEGLLGQASRFPRSLKGFDELLIFLVVDALRQPHIPFDRVQRQR